MREMFWRERIACLAASGYMCFAIKKNNSFIKTSFPFSSIFLVLLIEKWKKQIMFSSGPFQILKKQISGSFPIPFSHFKAEMLAVGCTNRRDHRGNILITPY